MAVDPRLTIIIDGPQAEPVKRMLYDLQATLGMSDLGDVLNFCLSLAVTTTEQAISGLRFGYYNASTDEVALYSFQALDNLMLLANEETPDPP